MAGEIAWYTINSPLHFLTTNSEIEVSRTHNLYNYIDPVYSHHQQCVPGPNQENQTSQSWKLNSFQQLADKYFYNWQGCHSISVSTESYFDIFDFAPHIIILNVLWHWPTLWHCNMTMTRGWNIWVKPQYWARPCHLVIGHWSQPSQPASQAVRPTPLGVRLPTKPAGSWRETKTSNQHPAFSPPSPPLLILLRISEAQTEATCWGSNFAKLTFCFVAERPAGVIIVRRAWLCWYSRRLFEPSRKTFFLNRFLSGRNFRCEFWEIAKLKFP